MSAGEYEERLKRRGGWGGGGVVDLKLGERE